MATKTLAHHKAGKSIEAPPEDRELLRDATLALLQPLKQAASPLRYARIRRIEERLRRFPVAPEIVLKIGKITETEGHSGPVKKGPRDKSAKSAKSAIDLLPLVTELISALSAVELVDPQLEVRVERFSKSIPHTIVPADVRRLKTQVAEISRLGHKVRKQTLQERSEMAQMLTDMSGALGGAGAQSDRVTGGIERIARTFVAMPMPKELATTRRQVLEELQSMHQRTRALRSGLDAAQARSRELEGMVSKTTEALHQARAQAATDPLTGLANRGAFDRSLAEGIQSARRMRRPYSLVIIDIDNFKAVNDTWGHPVGDEVLKSIADHMRAQLRDQDTVARYGGEEFALLLEGAPEATAFMVADRIRECVANAVVTIPAEDSADGHAFDVNVTLSAGIAVLAEFDSTEGLLKRADKALYEAKHAGRNRVVIG